MIRGLVLAEKRRVEYKRDSSSMTFLCIAIINQQPGNESKTRHTTYASMRLRGKSRHLKRNRKPDLSEMLM
eukprot:scaffold222827_cov22-Prasinocladus_malaysianus.AAC.1